MSTQFDQKNALAEQLRQMITLNISEAGETSRAEASLDALSFQSLIVPERHVWIEVDADGVSVDLEDWTSENEWDNAVARMDVESFAEVIEILQVWLSGAKLEEYSANVNKSYKRLAKKKTAKRHIEVTY